MSLEQYFIPISTMFVDEIRSAYDHVLYSVVMASYCWLISIAKEGGRPSYSDLYLDHLLISNCQRLLKDNFEAYVIERDTVNKLRKLDEFPGLLPKSATDRLKNMVSVIGDLYDKLPLDHSVIYLRLSNYNHLLPKEN